MFAASTAAIIFRTRCHMRNGLRLLRMQSNLKLFFIAVFAMSFEIGLWFLFTQSFKFLDSFGGVGMILIGRLFALFFTGLGVMLLFSGTVIAYASIYSSDEIPFLITRPFSMSQIVLYKFAEATSFSSWAFFFVIIPFTAAYAWHQKLSPLFAIWTLLFSIPFLLLICGIGTLLVMAIVRWFPRHRLVKIIGLPLLGVAAVAGWYFSGRMLKPLIDQQFNITQLIPGLKLAAYPFNPAWWTAEGITSCARGNWSRGILFFGVLSSSALMVIMLIEWLGSHTFYNAWQKTISGSRRRHHEILLPGLDAIFYRFTPADVGAIMLKDIRTFLRDASQWSQAVVFFGLLALYFANLRTFNYNALPDEWRSAIAFLNVFAVSAVLSSLGSRFVYPQLSLEGHGFWLLGLSPASKKRILLAKFLLALISMSIVSTALVWLSGNMLATAPAIRIAATTIIFCISLAVCGVSTGLGAVFLDLQQRNPAAIVSGFGGTLNLVICLSFMLLSILPFGIIFHFSSVGLIPHHTYLMALRLAGIWLASLTLVATILPLFLGLRALRNRDY